MKTLLFLLLPGCFVLAARPAAAGDAPASPPTTTIQTDSLSVRFIPPKGALPGGGTRNESLPGVQSRTNPLPEDEIATETFQVDPSWYLHYADNRAVVKRDSLYGYIDRSGREVIPCRYQKAYCFNDGMAMIRHNHQIFAIDTTGRRLDVRVDIPRFGGRSFTSFVGWVRHRIPFASNREYERMKGYSVNALITIGTDGSIVDIDKAGDYPDEFFEKIRGILKDAPRWTPGTVDEKPVSLRYLLPVDVSRIRMTPWTIVDPSPGQLERELVFPLFDGGYVPTTFYEWYKGRLRLPRNLYQKAKSGTVTVTFDIDEKGRLCNVIVNSFHDRICRDKVLEVLRSSPRWTPATVDGKPVAVRISWTFRFKFR